MATKTTKTVAKSTTAKKTTTPKTTQATAKSSQTLGNYTTVDTTNYNNALAQTPTYGEIERVNFDTNAWKQNYIDSLTAQAQQTLDSTNNTLDKNYNTDYTNYQNNKQDTLTNAAKAIDDLYTQRGNDYQSAKANSFARGLGFGGLGQAIEQTAINNANNNIANTVTERDSKLADIATAISQLTSNYGSDKLLANNTYNNSIAQALADAATNSAQLQLDVDKTNAGNYNTWLNNVNGLQNQNYLANLGYQADFATTNSGYASTEAQNALNRAWQANQNALDRANDLAVAGASSSYGSGYSGGSSGGSSGSTTSSNTVSDSGKTVDSKINLERCAQLIKKYGASSLKSPSSTATTLNNLAKKGDITVAEYNYIVSHLGLNKDSAKASANKKKAEADKAKSTNNQVAGTSSVYVNPYIHF